MGSRGVGLSLPPNSTPNSTATQSGQMNVKNSEAR